MTSTESYRAQLAIQQRVPLLSGIYSPPPTHVQGPDTAKRYEALENESKFITGQAKIPHLSTDSNPSSQPSRRNSTNRLGIFNKVFTTSPPPSPRFVTTFVTVILLPQAGTRPILLTLRTIDIRLEGHKDNHLSHVPDMRSFWGDGDPWHARIQKYSSLAMVKDSTDHVLTGTYMLLYTPEGNDLSLNQRWSAGVCGDACIAKLGKNMWGKGGVAAYEDIDREFLDGGLYRKMLMGMFDSPMNGSNSGASGQNMDSIDKEIS
ncbi:hypothetical protein SBOR_3441 [Sclerotinia borealis F-4128]|uniref:Uncharacterized protein n=1 Tax=Sclerotinia borealis (strain F-4128) TaxID=1432307 RepID=W9CJW7_SCLBF|nr:hypothetical protein SBOR_3441 [Sclerotinia borealis F-4128]